MAIDRYPKLEIPQTLAAGPGPGHTDERVLQAFATAGVADHMQSDVLRGLIECKHMLRELWGTTNIHTFAVAGTGWSGLDAMFSAVMPGDKVVAFSNGTFSSIDALTLRIKAATPDELAEDSLNPLAKSVVVIKAEHGESVSEECIDAALEEHQPKWAFMAHWETGSGRINDIRAFSDACKRHGVMGLVDAVSSFGVEAFAIDDYPGVVAWASCPQKGLCCLPLTYAPVSFRDVYIDTLIKNGAYTYVHHPIFEARHWGIIGGQDVEKGTYHRTHSPYAVAAFHESLRLALKEGLQKRAESYRKHEVALREAVTTMGCEVTSDMSSLVVLNLPADLSGREGELVELCRANGFGLLPTLSEPIQVRIGILNQLNAGAVRDIVGRFMDVLLEMGCDVDRARVGEVMDKHFPVDCVA